MVRRSSRLRDKAHGIQSDTTSTVSPEKQEESPETDVNEDDIESLVQKAYAIIKENIKKSGKTFAPTEITEDKITVTHEETVTSSADGPDSCKLSSALQPGLKINDLYFAMGKKNSQPMVGGTTSKATFDDKEIMKKSVITPDFEKRETAPFHVSHYALKKQKKLEKERTTGAGWFNMPAPEVTPELKRDLNIIKMRAVLDPKRHYKKNNTNKLPKYFQIGTVVSGPAEFYSSRLPKAQRKKTIIESLLADAEFRRYNKRKFLEIQATKQAVGRKGFHKRRKRR